MIRRNGGRRMSGLTAAERAEVKARVYELCARELEQLAENVELFYGAPLNRKVLARRIAAKVAAGLRGRAELARRAVRV